MMSANGLFYGEPEPGWVIDTAASQIIICRSVPSPPPVVEVPAPPPGPPVPEFRVLNFVAPLCCEGCVDRVVKHLLGVEGVEGVKCYYDDKIVTVKGYTPPEVVLKAVKKQLKRAEFWIPEKEEEVKPESAAQIPNLIQVSEPAIEAPS